MQFKKHKESAFELLHGKFWHCDLIILTENFT